MRQPAEAGHVRRRRGSGAPPAATAAALLAALLLAAAAPRPAAGAGAGSVILASTPAVVNQTGPVPGTGRGSFPVTADSQLLGTPQSMSQGIGRGLADYRAIFAEELAVRRRGANVAAGAAAAAAAAASRARVRPFEKVIPLGLGFGYINATYATRPIAAPSGCGGELSNDRQCGHPFGVDAVRYVATMEELVVPKGYPLEAYEVTTEDGYKLALYRIPHGRYRNTQRGPKPVVLLMHGVTLASSSFVVLNPNESLAFVLADAGFDVWMGNTRGNTYSFAHKTLNPYETAFWRFGYDQLALFDLPAMVDFALATSGAKKLAYVGHSQGCTLAFALLAARPEYNAKFSVVNHMGPVVFIDFLVAPFLRFGPEASLDQILITLGVPEFIPTRLTAPLVLRLCPSYPIDEVCSALVSYFFYGPSQFITPDDYAIISRTWPSGVSSRNLEQWAQQLRDRRLKFSYFDYGTLCNRTKWVPGRGFREAPLRETCNQAQYGSTEPPEYDLSKVTAPQAFYLAEFDVLTLSQDVTEVYRRLPRGTAVAQFEYPGYAHMDFVWDRNGLHHGDLVEVMLRYAPGTY